MRALKIHVTTLAVFSLVAASCGDDKEKSNDVNIIAVLPITGAFATRGEAHKGSAQLATTAINEAGGILGKKLRLHIVDSGDASKVVSRVQAKVDELTLDDGTVNVAGMISSTGGAYVASLPIALENRLPHFENADGAGNDEIINDEKGTGHLVERANYSFGTRGTCRPEATMQAEHLAHRQSEWQNVYLARGNQTHDKVHTNEIRRALGEMKTAGTYTANIMTTVDDEEIAYSESYESFFEALAAMNPRPDVVFWHLQGDAYNIRFMQDAKRVYNKLGWIPHLVTCGMSAIPTVVDATASGPNLMDFLPGRMWFSNRGPINRKNNPSDTNEKGDNVTFVEELNASIGKTADLFAPGAHDATMLIALGAAQAKSADGTAVRDGIIQVASGGELITYKDIPRALDLLAAGTDIDYYGPSGPLDITEIEAIERPAAPVQIIPSRYYIQEVQYTAGSEKGKYVIIADPAPTVKPE